MRLEHVEIRDYRSIFVDDGGQPFRLDLAEGANTLVGQNNCGKSNVLRAVSIALDPNHEFSIERRRSRPSTVLLPDHHTRLPRGPIATGGGSRCSMLPRPTNDHWSAG